MNIEEARKVLWLKSNPRPLGELLDEGYLTKERLEWAAEWAYNSKLKQAAKIILDSLNQQPETKPQTTESNQNKTGIEIDISLDDARSTLWTMKPYKGQSIGVLVNSRQLSLRDLGFAVEQAWDEKVRRAARALLLVRLNQTVLEPEPSAGPIHIISGGRSFSQSRESLLLILEGVFFGTIFGYLINYVLRFLSRPPNPNAKNLSDILAQPGGILAVAIVLLSVIALVWLGNFLINRVSNRLDEQIKQYRAGQEGEDIAVQAIAQALDGNWHLFRNISLYGRNKGDLDLVLVGPPGVWVLEVKNFHGEYRNIGDQWEYKHGKVWKPASVNPSRQADNNSLRLKNFLKADGINVYVNPSVIWANNDSKLFVENPLVAVWQHNRLSDELGNIWQGEKLAKAEREKIIEKLTKLCDLQKKRYAF